MGEERVTDDGDKRFVACYREEAKVRDGSWHDHHRSQVTFAEYVETVHLPQQSRARVWSRQRGVGERIQHPHQDLRHADASCLRPTPTNAAHPDYPDTPAPGHPLTQGPRGGRIRRQQPRPLPMRSSADSTPRPLVIARPR